MFFPRRGLRGSPLLLGSAPRLLGRRPLAWSCRVPCRCVCSVAGGPPASAYGPLAGGAAPVGFRRCLFRRGPSVGSPTPFPVFPAPGRGKARSPSGGLRPPSRGPRFSRSSRRLPRGPRRHRSKFSAPVNSPEIVNRAPPAAVSDHFTRRVKAKTSAPSAVPKCRRWCGLDFAGCAFFARRGLTFRARCGMLVFRSPFRPFGGRSITECPWMAKAAQLFPAGRLFSCSGPGSSLAESLPLANCSRQPDPT